ncbi:hypothetical protein [Phyllobacterium sophorae]|jgi:hypothetical protein|nr:hypothetical protein [Phyllobacterium sophorae]
MMKLKFFLPFVAVAALTLAACDNKPSEGTTTPPATTSEPTTPAPAPATPAPDPAKPAPAN